MLSNLKINLEDTLHSVKSASFEVIGNNGSNASTGAAYGDAAYGNRTWDVAAHGSSIGDAGECTAKNGVEGEAGDMGSYAGDAMHPGDAIGDVHPGDAIYAGDAMLYAGDSML